MERDTRDHYSPQVSLRAVVMYFKQGCSASSVVEMLGLLSI